MEERKEVVLTSVEQLNKYLNENGDDKSIISVVLELTGGDLEDGGESNG